MNYQYQKVLFLFNSDNSVTKNLRNIFKTRFCKETFKLSHWKIEILTSFFEHMTSS